MADRNHGIVCDLELLARRAEMEWCGSSGVSLRNVALAVEELLRQRQWQPIETAPRPSLGIKTCAWSEPLLVMRAGFVPAVVSWSAHNQRWEHWYGAAPLHYEPTHWMPLPAGPEVGDW